MGKKKNTLEIGLGYTYNSNIPEFLKGETCRDYEDHNKGFLNLAWPRNKKELKRYIKRILYDAKKYDRFHSFDDELVDNINDGKNRDYLNLFIHLDDFGKPRTKKEATICSFRHWFESVSDFYNRNGVDYYDD